MTKKTATLNLGNSLVIDQVSQLKERFDKSLGGSGSLDIHSDMITEIDLTGVQLLNYMLIQSRKAGKELKFTVRLAEEPRNLLNKSGFKFINETIFS